MRDPQPCSSATITAERCNLVSDSYSAAEIGFLLCWALRSHTLDPKRKQDYDAGGKAFYVKGVICSRSEQCKGIRGSVLTETQGVSTPMVRKKDLSVSSHFLCRVKSPGFIHAWVFLEWRIQLYAKEMTLNNESKCNWSVKHTEILLENPSNHLRKGPAWYLAWGRSFVNQALTVFVRRDQGQRRSINLQETISAQCISHIGEEEGCSVIDYWLAGSGLHPTMWS